MCLLISGSFWFWHSQTRTGARALSPVLKSNVVLRVVPEWHEIDPSEEILSISTTPASPLCWLSNSFSCILCLAQGHFTRANACQSPVLGFCVCLCGEDPFLFTSLGWSWWLEGPRHTQVIGSFLSLLLSGGFVGIQGKIFYLCRNQNQSSVSSLLTGLFRQGLTIDSY